MRTNKKHAQELWLNNLLTDQHKIWVIKTLFNLDHPDLQLKRTEDQFLPQRFDRIMQTLIKGEDDKFAWRCTWGISPRMNGDCSMFVRREVVAAMTCSSIKNQFCSLTAISARMNSMALTGEEVEPPKNIPVTVKGLESNRTQHHMAAS